MNPRLKKRFILLCKMLSIIRENPEDCITLYRMQLLLIALIRRTEKSIVTIKDDLASKKREKKSGRLDKNKSKELKERIHELEEILIELRQQLFGWRFFGDAIAYAYHDKYALKHLFYNVHDYSVKQSAGFLSDKEGFATELSVLRAARDQNHPVLLCDLTNILRHGDICMLGGPDPALLEIKSSANLSSRAMRQIEALSKLESFFTTDRVENFRGRLVQTRVETIRDELNHRAVVDKCIATALASESGFSSVSPEDGLIYSVVINDRNASPFLVDLLKESDFVCNLNHGMIQAHWCPLSPCFLYFSDPEHAYLFATGAFDIVIIVRPKILIERFKQFNLALKFVKHENAMMITSRIGDQSGTYAGVPHLAFRRLFYEFESIHDLIRMELWMLSYLDDQGKFLQAHYDQHGSLPPESDTVESLVFEELELEGAPYIFV